MANSPRTTIAFPEKSRSGPCSKSWSLPMDKPLSRRRDLEETGPSELHCSLGDFPGANHESTACREAMEDEMKAGDVRMVDKSKGYGPTIRYLLPRALQREGRAEGVMAQPLPWLSSGDRSEARLLKR